MKPCTHKSPPDHKEGPLWICTNCKARGAWGPEWTYFGTIECRRCGWPEMDWVACSEACARALGEPAPEKAARLERENKRLKARLARLAALGVKLGPKP